MKLITVTDMQALIRRVGLEPFLALAVDAIEDYLRRWPELQLSPRHAFHYPFGVTELMPCADDRLYGVKYVNGHPGNPARGKLSVTAIGLLADVPSGYPLMISEMTLLTAVRTAAVAALAAGLLARLESQRVALIGCGAQAEFQVLALASRLPVTEVNYFDIDGTAMDKFAGHLGHRFRLRRGQDIADTLRDADVWITLTAAKQHQSLIDEALLRPGVHINAMGGDCPGKTELSPEVIRRCKTVVEYRPQSEQEGEIQQTGAASVHAELWEVLTDQRPGRDNDDEITLFDAVGIAVEDLAVLDLVARLAERYDIGSEVTLVPDLADPKDLFSLVAGN